MTCLTKILYYNRISDPWIFKPGQNFSLIFKQIIKKIPDGKPKLHLCTISALNILLCYNLSACTRISEVNLCKGDLNIRFLLSPGFLNDYRFCR
jgi:hypothetical protein